MAPEGSHPGSGVGLHDSRLTGGRRPVPPTQAPLPSRQSIRAGWTMGRGGVGAVMRFTELYPTFPEPWKPAVAPSLGPHPCPLTNARHTVLSQHRPVLTEADDLVALGVHVALVHLTVAAVQVMLNVHFPVAFHHCGQGWRVSLRRSLGRPPRTRTRPASAPVSGWSVWVLWSPFPGPTAAAARLCVGQSPVPLGSGDQRCGCIDSGGQEGLHAWPLSWFSPCYCCTF